MLPGFCAAAWFRPDVGEVGEAAVQCDGAYTCVEEECGAVFRDRQAVLDHIMSAHGWRLEVAAE